MDPILSNLLSSFLQEFLKIAIPVLVGTLVTYAIMALRHFSAILKERVPAEQLQFVKMWAGLLVKAAEQEGVKNQLLQYGEAKKERVLSELQRVLKENNINLDMETISAIIESAVYEELTRQKAFLPVQLPEVKPEA